MHANETLQPPRREIGDGWFEIFNDLFGRRFEKRVHESLCLYVRRRRSLDAGREKNVLFPLKYARNQRSSELFDVHVCVGGV